MYIILLLLLLVYSILLLLLLVCVNGCESAGKKLSRSQVKWAGAMPLGLSGVGGTQLGGLKGLPWCPMPDSGIIIIIIVN